MYALAQIYETKLNDLDKAKELYEKIFMDYSGSIFAVEARKARIPVLEPFQGTVRHRVEQLLDKAFLDYRANKPPHAIK